MKKTQVEFPSGERFYIRQSDEGWYCCPVCGRDELRFPPYENGGVASGEVCACGFHFVAEKGHGLRKKWRDWRRKLIDEVSNGSISLAKLESYLKNIGIRLAFDLIEIEDEEA